MAEIKYLLFDAANTLIHKPDVWNNIQNVLLRYGYNVNDEKLRYHHKLISELFVFPDRTSSEFYSKFNSELLYSLGIVPRQDLLTEIFNACTYLPWKPFDDTTVLQNLELPIGIISNFKSSLRSTITELFGNIFKNIITSEELSCAKPETRFYRQALECIDISPSNIVYIGDSVKLDMEPALSLGLKAYLIDRDHVFPNYPYKLSDLQQLPGILDEISKHQ